MSASRPAPGPRVGRARSARALVYALAAALVLAGCEDGSGPDDLPFGRSGELRVQVYTPVPGLKPTTESQLRQGALLQVLSWRSNGTWRLTEGIYYRNGLGDETVRRSGEDAATLAQRYADLIGLVNARGGPLELVDQVDPDIEPVCGSDQSLVTVTLVDSQRADSTSWSRCANGSLATLTALASDPDVGAGRVIDAARLAREATLQLDRDFRNKGYAYTGSLPFRTIDRGEVTKLPLVLPRVIEDVTTWAAFWSQYMTSPTPPAVDFASEVVLVAAVGTRQEAGDSVEIRRVLPIEFGTKIQLWERRPGNFCTPAPRVHAPFHIAVAPIAVTPRPIFFEVEGEPDFVPCG